jgi:predicted dehydrogenase/threonine dehydrogenase-like Zn-dependent dehydrogenase
MQQVIRRGLREIIVDELPDPEVIAQHVLIRSHFSLISTGTETADIHQDILLKEVARNPGHLQKIWQAMKSAGPVRTLAEVRAKFTEYGVLGYSGAGVIIDIDPKLTDLRVGDRVAYGGQGTGHAEIVRTGRNLTAKVPSAVSFEHACFATLGAIAMNAVRIASLGIGETVAVIGQGLVGQLVSQLVRVQGAIVVATDLRQERLDLAQSLGAHHTLLADSALPEAVLNLTEGRGVDCVIITAAAKSSVPCQQAVSICRDRGRIVVVGAVQMNFDWSSMYLKEIQVYMARAYGPGSYDPSYEVSGQDYPLPYVRWTENRNMREFLRLVGERQVQIQPLITHVFPLDEAPQAYHTIMDASKKSLAVLLRYRAADEVPFDAQSVPVRRIVAAPPKKASTSVALVGAGNLARWTHLPILRKISGTALRAVCSGSSVRAKSYARRFGAHYACTSYSEILSDPEIDAVIITSRNQVHASQAIAALRAGKHVFLEKPMATTEEECMQLWVAVCESRKMLAVGFNRRFAPLYVEIKTKLTRRTGPAVINCRVNSPGISGSYWMADPTFGGAILGEACHFVDLMYWLLDSEPVLVSAYSLPTGKKEPVGENNLAASFSFADGSIGNLTYCTVGSLNSGGELVEVFAQGISAMTTDFKRLRMASGLIRRKSRLWADKGYAEEMNSFISSIRRGEIPVVTVRDGIRSTIACLRMLDSARETKPFKIDFSRIC